jgi:hypothetical protein
MSSERTMYISETEAWTIDDLIRHTWTEEGKNIGRGLLIKVFAVLREFDARRASPPDTLPIALTEEECWVIDYHIRRSYVDPAGNPVGRQILLKIFGTLLAIRNAEAVRTLRLRDAEVGQDEPGLRGKLDDLREFLDRGEGGDGPKDG